MNDKGDEQKNADETGPCRSSHEGAGGGVRGRTCLGHAQNQVQAQDHYRCQQGIDRVVMGLLHVSETERQQHR